MPYIIRARAAIASCGKIKAPASINWRQGAVFAQKSRKTLPASHGLHRLQETWVASNLLPACCWNTLNNAVSEIHLQLEELQHALSRTSGGVARRRHCPGTAVSGSDACAMLRIIWTLHALCTMVCNLHISFPAATCSSSHRDTLLVQRPVSRWPAMLVNRLVLLSNSPMRPAPAGGKTISWMFLYSGSKILTLFFSIEAP